MIVFDSDTSVLTFTRNANIATGQFYSSATLSNGDGTQDLVSVPISGIGFASDPVNSGDPPIPSYPPNPPWQIEEFYIIVQNQAGSVNHYKDCYHRVNGGAWEHRGYDFGTVFGNGWKGGSQFMAATGDPTVTRSTWVYGSQSTGALKTDSATFTLDAAKLWDVAQGGTLRISFLSFGSLRPCTVRIGSSFITVDGGGESHSSIIYITPVDPGGSGGGGGGTPIWTPDGSIVTPAVADSPATCAWGNDGPATCAWGNDAPATCSWGNDAPATCGWTGDPTLPTEA